MRPDEKFKAVPSVKTTALKWIRTTKVKMEALFSWCAKWLQQMTTQRNPFAPSAKELEQARLMGMYLVHANTKPLYAAPRAVSRERFRGRQAYVRETVSHFPR